MELTPEQKAVYDTYQPILKTMGFDVTVTDLAVEVKGIPVLCEQTEVGSIFEAIFELGAPEANTPVLVLRIVWQKPLLGCLVLKVERC